ncbi:hypothetical protein AB0C21_29770 [Spirillospora sp. NPDC049024]
MLSIMAILREGSRRREERPDRTNFRTYRPVGSPYFRHRPAVNDPAGDGPFAVGAGPIVLGIVILAAGHRELAGAERRRAELDARAARGEPEAGGRRGGGGRLGIGVARGGAGVAGAAARPIRRRATTCAADAKKRRSFLRGGA